MKLTLSLAALALLGTAAWADFTVEESTESPFGSGTMVFKVKGNRARVETPSNGGGTSVTLIDLDAGEMIQLVPSEKVAVHLDLAQARQKAENAMKAAGLDPTKATIVPTGQKEHVSMWDAEIYNVTVAGVEIRVWVTSQFPSAREYREQLARFTRAASGGALDPNTFDLPGMVVKSSADSPQGKFVTTVKGIREGILPESDFTIPPGYHDGMGGIRIQ